MEGPFLFSSLSLSMRTGTLVNIKSKGTMEFIDGFCYIHKRYNEPGTKHDFMIPVDLISKIEFDRTVD